MGRLTIDITDDQHQQLKAAAALQGKTVRQYAIERLFLAQPGEDRSWQELKALLGQRIEEGLSGTVSARDYNAIVEDELRQDSRA